MFRVVAREFGPPAEVLALEPGEKPRPAPGIVLVRMRASAINPSDLISTSGAYRHRTSLPFVPGFDSVGVVAEAGDGVDPRLVGGRVLPLGSAGAWQTWKAVPAKWCVPVPNDVGDDAAAMAYVNPLTARLMMRALAPRPGDRVGITAGASAIGRMLARHVASAGATPIAIVRSEGSRDDLLDGPAEVVLEHAPLPIMDAGLDAVGGLVGARLAAAVRPAGRFIHYGLLSGRPLTSDLLAGANVTLRQFRLRDWVHSVSRDTLRAEMEGVFDDLRVDLSRSVIAARFPLASFPQALTADARAGRRGKIVLTM